MYNKIKEDIQDEEKKKSWKFCDEREREKESFTLKYKWNLIVML